MSEQFDDARRQTLRAVCDTVVPSIERIPDPHSLWGRSATDLGVDQAAEQALLAMPAPQLAGMLELLDSLTRLGFAAQSRRSREWGADEADALRVARRIRTGQVELNGAAHNPLAPFGGVKQSGHGPEYGPWGMVELTTLKAIQR